MKVTLFDDQEHSNPVNGRIVESENELMAVLDRFKRRRPFLFHLDGENGYSLVIGMGDSGCVQHTATDGSGAYLMAVMDRRPQNGVPDLEFLAAGTPTPASARYAIPFETIKDIARYFLRTGERNPSVCWEEDQG